MLDPNHAAALLFSLGHLHRKHRNLSKQNMSCEHCVLRLATPPFLKSVGMLSKPILRAFCLQRGELRFVGILLEDRGHRVSLGKSLLKYRGERVLLNAKKINETHANLMQIRTNLRGNRVSPRRTKESKKIEAFLLK